MKTLLLKQLTIAMCISVITTGVHSIPKQRLKNAHNNTIQAIYEAQTAYYCTWLDRYVSESEFELMCRTVYCESGNQNWNAQVMVAITILNRLESSKYPDDIRGVIYQKGAYNVTNWKNFESREWSDVTEIAVKNALAATTHPRDMFYFRDDHYHGFGKPYVAVDNMYFSTAE